MLILLVIKMISTVIPIKHHIKNILKQVNRIIGFDYIMTSKQMVINNYCMGPDLKVCDRIIHFLKNLPGNKGVML